MNEEEIKRKVLSYLGFAKKSGRVLVGQSAVTDGARSGAARAVILASDASERTKKQINDKCSSHGVKIAPVALTGDEIARALGSGMTVSAAAVTDAGLASAILKTVCDGDQPNDQLKERIFPRESGNR